TLPENQPPPRRKGLAQHCRLRSNFLQVKRTAGLRGGDLRIAGLKRGGVRPQFTSFGKHPVIGRGYMGPVKRVLLGSAAGVFAAAGAQAADLPVKAKPVEYVKVCSLYGAGFWYVPGTDTCIKIGSFVRVQTSWNNTTSGPHML